MLKRRQNGFTIVELLIVIVLIAILAAIAFVVYSGIQDRAEVAVLESDLSEAAKQLSVDKVLSGSFPADIDDANEGEGITPSGDITYQYTSTASTFCLTATKGTKAYHIEESGSPEEGVCAGHNEPGSGGGSVIADGSFIQDITSENCPTTRTRAVDARDNHTYWVQELADGKCWMLTNLGYAGSGTNTYGDVKSLTNGTGGSWTYTTPSYYVIPSTTNYTTEPTNPSTSTDGTGQYGYLYNWCGAMGGQTSTSACASTSTPMPDTAISICPAGWRLPTGNGGEFTVLNNAINGGSTGTDTGLRMTWLVQHSAFWNNMFYQGPYGNYWSSTQHSSANAYRMYFGTYFSTPGANYYKYVGFGVRCIAN